MKKVNTLFPYKVGEQVWFFSRDDPISDLEVKPILDISLNGKIAVKRMKDGRPLYLHKTTFFFAKNDAIEFMIKNLATLANEFRQLALDYTAKIRSLEAERYENFNA